MCTRTFFAPNASSFGFNSFNRSRRRAPKIRPCPASAKTSAHASPMPEEAPVMHIYLDCLLLLGAIAIFCDGRQQPCRGLHLKIPIEIRHRRSFRVVCGDKNYFAVLKLRTAGPRFHVEK